jgi:hypothetical protein
MSQQVIEAPPETHVEETLLRYHVHKVTNGNTEVVFKSKDQGECWDWMVGKYLEEMREKGAERDWQYCLVERRKFITTEVMTTL